MNRRSMDSDAEWLAYCKRHLAPRFRHRARYLAHPDHLSLGALTDLQEQAEQDVALTFAGMTQEGIDAMIAADVRWLMLWTLRKQNAAKAARLRARATIRVVQ